MKQQRLRFKVLALVLFGMFLLLSVYSGYSIITYGNRWFSSRWNPRIRAQKETVVPGDVLDQNGIVLATTLNGRRLYHADEATRRSVVHLLGDTEGQVSNGVETFQASYLYGFQSSLWDMVTGLLAGQERKGDNIHLTIDSRLCSAIPTYFEAHEKTAGKNGAAVVMNYKTGEVLAIISLPNFDPLHIDATVHNHPGHPFWNRATQSVYAPGSSFKVITTVAALDHIDDIQNRSITCNGGLTVENHAIRDWGNEVHGSLSLKRAFTLSCNNAYALMALDMGDEALRTTAEAFGFNDNFLFRDLVVENSTYPTQNRNLFEVAWSGAGQSAIAASPMHMCMEAAAIANDGVMMEPRLLSAVTTPSGSTKATLNSKAYCTATTPANAAILQSLMRSVVTSGTGRQASQPDLTVCGKTGSAESSLEGQAVTHGWFIGFAKDEDCPYAMAVLVEAINEGDGGGSTAAVIAGDIFRYLAAHQRKNSPIASPSDLQKP